MRDLLDRDERPAFVTPDEEGTTLWGHTRGFYEARAFAPAWIEKTAPTARMDALVQALNDARHEGLDPDLYGATVLERKRLEGSSGFLTAQGFEPQEAAALDVWLTYLYMKYTSDLANGVSDLSAADPNWHIATDPFDPREHLEAALAADRVVESLSELLPVHREYRALRDVMADYRDMAAAGGWPEVPADLRLAPGDEHPAVATLARRLAITGDHTGPLPGDTPDTPAAYGADLQEAVTRFQARHGLTASGRVDAATVAALNVPADVRVQQIALNLERWRWLPRELGDRRVLVNIPEMQLRVYETDDVALAMRVVVGTLETQTPIFNDEMSYLVFSPYWNVPDSIAQGETLPAAIQDPSYLARNNMEIIDRSGQIVDPETLDEGALENYRFRQRPGAANALGLVKFMFPNKYNVYLHDTPAESLFTRANRAFSHGCVRLEEPVALAEYVLRDQPDWDTGAIRAAMRSGTEQTVRLTAPLPVYLGYWTARVDEEGIVHFLPDIYGIDDGQARRVAVRLERLRETEMPAVESSAE